MLPENEKLLDSFSNVEVAVLIATRAKWFASALNEQKRELAHRYLEGLKEMISFYESNY